MMYKVIPPPKDEKVFAETGKTLFTAATNLGLTLEKEGFLLSWASGTVKVVAEADAETNIIGMALIAHGRRWTDSTDSASVLEMVTKDRPKMLEYIKNICAMLNVSSIYYEAVSEDEEGVSHITKEIKF